MEAVAVVDDRPIHDCANCLVNGPNIGHDRFDVVLRHALVGSVSHSASQNNVTIINRCSHQGMFSVVTFLILL
jgi:hypothetical protein